MEEFVNLVQGRMTVTEYAQIFDRLACYAPDRARRDKFIRGLNSMVARDVSITMSLTETTYAQVVERAFLAERAEQLISRQNAARREVRKAAKATSASQRTGDSGDQKRKAPDSASSMGVIG